MFVILASLSFYIATVLLGSLWQDTAQRLAAESQLEISQPDPNFPLALTELISFNKRNSLCEISHPRRCERFAMEVQIYRLFVSWNDPFGIGACCVECQLGELSTDKEEIAHICHGDVTVNDPADTVWQL